MSFILGVQLYIMYVGTFSSILGTWIFCWTYEVRDNFGAGVVLVSTIVRNLIFYSIYVGLILGRSQIMQAPEIEFRKSSIQQLVARRELATRG